MKTIAALAALLLSLSAAAENAAPNLDIANPLTVTIHHSIQQRHSRLVKFLEPGVIGLQRNGDLGVRDHSRLGKVATRQIVEKLLDAENSDRQALIAAVAYAHNRKEAIEEFRRLMAAKWAKEMKPGWWLQDENGTWFQKP